MKLFNNFIWLNLKRISFLSLFFLTALLISDTAAAKQVIRIGFLSTQKSVKADDEVSAAYKFLKNNQSYVVTRITFEQIKQDPKLLDGNNVLWFHKPDSAGFSESAVDKSVICTINNFISDGGGLLLTLDAFRYINILGLEKQIPGIRYQKIKDQGNGRKLGLHALRSHPIFDGLHGGANIWNGYKDNVARKVGFFGSSVPRNGKVVAVNWAYITLRDSEKLAVEYRYGKGKVLAIGAYTYFAPRNYNRLSLEKFTNNCLLYLANALKSKEKARYWSYSPLKVLPFTETTPSVNFPRSKSWGENSNSLAFKLQRASGSTWDLGEERILMMGKERGGLDEIWIHPFMAFRDYKVGVEFSDKDSVCWLDEQRPEIEARPESFTRTYRFPRAVIKEIMTSDIHQPAGIIHYAYKGQSPAKFIIQFKSNLRFMWPYNSDALGSLYYGWSDGLNAFHVKNKSGEFNVLIGSNKKPLEKRFGRFDGFSKKGTVFEGKPTTKFQVSGLVAYAVQKNDRFDVVLVGTDEGKKAAFKYYEQAMKNPEKIYKNTIRYYRDFLDTSLMITTPDKEFNQGYRWALVGTDKFYVNTPGIGKSLVAGYATTARGWDGSQKVSGRPGYAWYFGRDGQWSGLALSDYGDFGKVKSELEVYQKYQALSGKIYHELTTSGVVHYDAADATPLYLILAGHYLRWSGDLNFIRKSWKHIKKAIDFCFSTDWNQDHLIENTHVGHGWIEGGPLYGAQTTLYLASCWAEALKEASYMAKNLGYEKEAKYYHKEFQRVTGIINRDFWNSKKKFFYYGKLADGSFNAEKTVLPAVSLYFNLIDKEKVFPMLNEYGENSFSSNWGVRILRESSPLFNPRGYHDGSVWPLFTGWAALAEYSHGQYTQGFSHIMNNLLVYKHWAKGYIEEVLNGEIYKPSGVCDHQCWSETMVLQPALEGMLGLKADAMENRLSLSPRLPFNWNSIKVEHIRVGYHTLSFTLRRDKGKTTYYFFHTGSKSLKVDFSPQFPSGSVINGIFLDGKPVKNSVISNRQAKNINLNFDIKDKATIVIYHYGGIGVLPNILHPVPGSRAGGFRIVSSKLDGKSYTVVVQGKPGSKEILKIYSPVEQVKSVVNAEMLHYKNNIYSVQVPFPKSSNKYLVRKIKFLLR